MAVVKSSIIEDRAQADGRRDITELHILDDGSSVLVNYLAPQKWDALARLAESAKETEIEIARENDSLAQGLIAASVGLKTASYIKSLSDVALSNAVGLTPTEIDAVKAAGP